MKSLRMLFYLAVLGVGLLSLGYLIHETLHGSAVALLVLACIFIGSLK